MDTQKGQSPTTHVRVQQSLSATTKQKLLETYCEKHGGLHAHKHARRQVLISRFNEFFALKQCVAQPIYFCVFPLTASKKVRSNDLKRTRCLAEYRF